MVVRKAHFAFFSNDNKLLSSTSGSIGAEAIEVLASSNSGNSDAATVGLTVGKGRLRQHWLQRI